MWIFEFFYVEVFVDWWDKEVDKFFLIGVFKYGYEKYNFMWVDFVLCFLEWVGMFDVKVIVVE